MIYVCDRDRVDVFDPQWHYLGWFGGAGTGDGQFQTADGVVVNGTKTIFVIDYGNNRIQKFAITGPWPAPAASAGDGAGSGSGAAATLGDPENEAVLADSVGLALLVVLDTLTPAERLAFVLHDMFAMPFTEVADVLGRTPDATRQLASRARRRVRGAPSPDHAADITRQREVAAAFLAASRGGDMAALVALLDSDVTLTADAAAVPAGRPAVLHGAKTVANGAIAAAAIARESQLALVDGAVGIVFVPAGQLRVALALTVGQTGRITAIDVIADPDRLRRLHLAVLPG